MSKKSNISEIKKGILDRRLKDIKLALSKLVKEEFIDNWLSKPNEAFDNLTPLQLIELGEHRRIYDMIDHLSEGSNS